MKLDSQNFNPNVNSRWNSLIEYLSRPITIRKFSLIPFFVIFCGILLHNITWRTLKRPEYLLFAILILMSIYRGLPKSIYHYYSIKVYHRIIFIGIVLALLIYSLNFPAFSNYSRYIRDCLSVTVCTEVNPNDYDLTLIPFVFAITLGIFIYYFEKSRRKTAIKTFPKMKIQGKLIGPFQFSKALDGDTIELLSEGIDKRFRLMGIESFEIDGINMSDAHERKLIEQAKEFNISKDVIGILAREAQNTLGLFLRGKRIYVEMNEPRPVDKYERWLTYVYIEDDDEWIGEWIDENHKRYHNINCQMIGTGYAFPYLMNDSPYKMEFAQYFYNAWQSKSGAWNRLSKSHFVNMEKIFDAIRANAN